VAWYQGIASLHVADDHQTVLVVLDVKGGERKRSSFAGWFTKATYTISPEKAPDPKTGIFKPWILRTKVK